MVSIGLREDGRILLKPAGTVRPLNYSVTTNLHDTSTHWRNVPGVPNFQSRELAVVAPSGSAFYRANYADLPTRNYYLGVPANTDLSQAQTLCLVAHPRILTTTAGEVMEAELARWLHEYGLLTLFPTALGFDGSPPYSYWDSDAGGASKDLAALESGISACLRLVPTIKGISVVGYSQGGATATGLAITLAVTRPELDIRLLVIGGQDNPGIANLLNAKAGEAPFRFEKPIPTVFVAATMDSYALFPSMRGAQWITRANSGFSGDANTLPRMDFHDSVAGLDVTPLQFGPDVMVLESAAPNHDASLYFNDPGFDSLYRDFVRDGSMPGQVAGNDGLD